MVFTYGMTLGQFGPFQPVSNPAVLKLPEKPPEMPAERLQASKPAGERPGPRDVPFITPWHLFY